MRGLAGLALLAAFAAQAVPFPRIVAIEFEGNEVTQPKVMLREMSIGVGSEADPERIERSRQAVQDLGLFREVTVREVEADGGVRLLFKVKEKYYILPLPRTDISSDGGYAYGAQLRMSNLWGLNHKFNPYFERRKASEGPDDPEKRDVQTRTQLRYVAPYAFDSPYTLGVHVGYFATPYLEPIRFDEDYRFARLELSRKLSAGPGSQGWLVGGVFGWRNQTVSGPDSDLARHEGRALSLGAGVTFRDLRYNIYSDEGVEYNASVESAGRAYGSDYHFTNWAASVARYLEVGDTPHQTVHFLGNLGARHGGPPGGQEAFSIGGVESLRGFEPETVKGDAYYLFSAEYLRPVFRKSIRALVVLDAANAFDTPRDANLDKVLVSGGIGVRFRIQALVNLDFELGVAWPLNGDGGMRFFASKV